MATYKKTLKTIVVKTIGGTTITAQDAKRPNATNALSEFEAFKTMHIQVEDTVTLVPFHAVDSIVVTETKSEVTRPDAYCGE